MRSFTTIASEMKPLYKAIAAFLFIQVVHYVLLMPLVMFDPNKTERQVILWLTVAGLVGLVLFWKNRNKEKLHGNVIKILLGVQWVWLVGLLWATFGFPWVYASEPTWLDRPIQVTYIHPLTRYSFNFLLVFPFLKYITQKQFFGKWIDRALWHLPFLIYLLYLVSLMFQTRPIFIG